MAYQIPSSLDDEARIRIAEILENGEGYIVCGEEAICLDKGGRVFPTKYAAMQAAVVRGYTHATGSGTYWGAAIRSLDRFKP